MSAAQRRASFGCGDVFEGVRAACALQELLLLADWLRQRGLDFHATQRQGHTPLHKAAWGGHVDLCRWRRDVCGARAPYFFL